MDYRNVVGFWVPHFLSDHHKHERVQCAKNLLSLHEANDNFINLYAVQDESWIYFQSHKQSQPKVWVRPDGDRPQMQRFTPMTNKKTMLSVCLSPNGRFFLTTTPYGKAINADEFINFMKRMRKRRRNSINFNSLLLQFDNAPSHNARNDLKKNSCSQQE